MAKINGGHITKGEQRISKKTPSAAKLGGE